MTMRKRTWVLVIAMLCSAGAGCKSGDDDDDTGGSGTGASGTGASGTGAGTGASGTGASGEGASGEGAGDVGGCLVTGDINPDCPQVPPVTGDCAPRGACCHRSSNILKEEALGADEPLELEYRVNYSTTTNHPTTIGVDFLADSTTTRYNNEQQSTLWRFTVPRMGGMQVSGPGKAQIGVGRYNCNEGTYSYYTNDAAPDRAPHSSDVTRWVAEEVPTMVDVSAQGADRIKIAFADNANRDLTWTPFLDNAGMALDWELVHQGFTIVDIDIAGEGRDCVGARSGAEWDAGGEFVIYTPMNKNDSQIITLIQQTYCSLVAFGILPEGMKERKCLDSDSMRCLPDGGAYGDGGCDWEKLPDSLCPDTEEDKMLWGCHLGDEANVNMEMGYPSAADINCTQEEPTAVADPDSGGSPGQCCDPMGESATLPACNSYRLRQAFVAAAAEITEDEKNMVQQDCLP